MLVFFSDIYLFDQMVRVQQTRDQRILVLVTAMENAYSFMVSADELKSRPVLQEMLEQILKRMWAFHSGIYATQLWKYVASFFERSGSELKIEQSVIVRPF